MEGRPKASVGRLCHPWGPTVLGGLCGSVVEGPYRWSPEALVRSHRKVTQQVLGRLQANHLRMSQPNILFIMSDDHAANAISCYGSRLAEVAPTPNIDRIAAGGVRLDNCFCTNSICTPSRATILSGQYSHVNGVYTLRDDYDPNHLTVAGLMQDAGYQTAMIGHRGRRRSPRRTCLRQKTKEHEGACPYSALGPTSSSNHFHTGT